MRILLMGDHQIKKAEAGYEWLMKKQHNVRSKKKYDLTEKHQHDYEYRRPMWTKVIDHEQIQLFKSQLMSPYLPIMTAVGNHETYNDPGMQRYAAHYHYENLTYQGISSGMENYYALPSRYPFSLFCPPNIPATPKKNG